MKVFALLVSDKLGHKWKHARDEYFCQNFCHSISGGGKLFSSPFVKDTYRASDGAGNHKGKFFFIIFYGRGRLCYLLDILVKHRHHFFNAIFHAGPIIRPLDDDKFEMVSVGPTTSMRMEKFEYEFVKETGVRVIVGKGGMKENTERACKEFGAIHCVFPAGNAVVAAAEVEEIVKAEWRDLGMPETLWNCRVKEFGPLIVSIDSDGRNYFEEKKVEYNKKKDEQVEAISKQVGFIK